MGKRSVSGADREGEGARRLLRLLTPGQGYSGYLLPGGSFSLSRMEPVVICLDFPRRDLLAGLKQLEITPVECVLLDCPTRFAQRLNPADELLLVGTR